MDHSRAIQHLNQGRHLDGIDGRAILIIHQSVMMALKLAEVVIREGGWVVGPANSVEDAKRLLDTMDIDGAIIDAAFGEEACFEMAEVISQQSVPFVFSARRTDLGRCGDRWPMASLRREPTTAERLVNRLAIRSQVASAA